ncbi:MAG: hypothetical protein WCV67_02695 [Victivallaceae bacterium]|jgi:tetratricopeptide (TPR) repeat protein
MSRILLSVFSFVLISAFAVNAEPAFKELYDSAVKNYNQKKYDDSLQDIDKALALTENDAEKLQALFCKYNNYIAQRKLADAAGAAGDIAKLEKLTGAQRNLWLFNQIKAYYDSGKFDECITACDQLIRSDEQENRELGYHYKAIAYSRKNDNDKLFDNANKFAGDIGESRHPMYYRAVIWQMTALNTKKEYDKAIAVITPAEAKRIPGVMKSEYYNLLGNIYRNKKKNTEAAAAFEKAAQGDHTYQGAVGWFSLGDVYAGMNRDSEAMYAFTKCYEMNEGNPGYKVISIVRCAELLNKSSKSEEALVLLEKADAFPGANPEWGARGKILAAKILVQQNKKDAAKKQLAAAVNVKGAPAAVITQAKAELEKLK